MKKLKQNSQKQGIAFISSPYAAVLRHIQDKQYANHFIKSYARFGCKKALDNQFVPFSPVLTFEGIFDENQRDLIMQHCFEIISKSQVLYVVKTGYFHLSSGMQDEIAYAKSLNLPIMEIEFLSKSFNGEIK